MEITRREKILKTALDLFLHHGFAKVTLVDIAEEVGISRPTLYQVFSNKEEIFKALILKWQEDALSRIAEKNQAQPSLREQLEAAIEVWIVETYMMIQASPRAADFQDDTFAFAEDAIEQGYAAYESLLKGILEGGRYKGMHSIGDTAQLMVQALRGFKAQAKTVEELRKLVQQLLDLILA